MVLTIVEKHAKTMDKLIEVNKTDSFDTIKIIKSPAKVIRRAKILFSFDSSTGTVSGC